ncbi:zinc finger FYVE domain-containing protein 1 [Patella vulgata]|uniref:zinc finger FYVE domain-containing protein 1 n=1 Tax=Patella vulgata TaxID=6465 RepID=UPI0024A95147|nr:zinc finger FYVE domain-containing protein 1 [Patella vulgata]
MKAGSKKSSCRSSIRTCEEKYSCETINPEAIVFCLECNSAQCLKCDSGIHSLKKNQNHTRENLPTPNAELLCQISELGGTCKNKNYADFFCQTCFYRLCSECNDKYHLRSDKTNRKHHIRITMKEHMKKGDNKQACDKLMPLSPVAFDDDSLTYITCPQQDNFADGTKYQTQSFHSDSSSIPDICQDVGNMEIRRDIEASFRLSTEEEHLEIENEPEFLEKLGCEENELVKVISIFGNTGDGKSYTLNHTLFDGKEVFKTSSDQNSCTIGTWAAYDPQRKAVAIDTEGLLGVSPNQNQRTRLLLKVLAISDVVIYRTRAERLHNDMFAFLGSASKAYLKHFAEELKTVSQKCKNTSKVSILGPAVIVFHETTHTEPFKSNDLGLKCPGIRQRIIESECSLEAFSDVRYVGTKTKPGSKTEFVILGKVISDLFSNNNIRAARQPCVVLQALKMLNKKFSGDIEKPMPESFPDQYFTCTEKCLACGGRCIHSMNHRNGTHETSRDTYCRYVHELGNKVYLCKNCKKSGQQRIVVPKISSSNDSSWLGISKYLWSGFVLECPKCGIIYRSRQHWYGNKEVDEVADTDIRHMWPGNNTGLEGSHNAARKFLDGFNYVADTISTISAKPTKVLTEWTADKIAPEYWIPNAQILECAQCSEDFTSNQQKHHCRACGKGFCDKCSSKTRPVPERGWGYVAVRVCDECFDDKKIREAAPAGPAAAGDSSNTARKVGEAVSSTFGVVASAIEYPLEMIKDSARPDYWIPDDKIKDCHVCKSQFDLLRLKHHCRSCGHGVCDDCSPNRLPVPLRGWDYPVRICVKCEKNKDRI